MTGIGMEYCRGCPECAVIFDSEGIHGHVPDRNSRTCQSCERYKAITKSVPNLLNEREIMERKRHIQKAWMASEWCFDGELQGGVKMPDCRTCKYRGLCEKHPQNPCLIEDEEDEE